MAQYSMNLSENREFIHSDRWRCEKSPGGAHYWIVHNFEMTCRYCNSRKETDGAGVGWPKPGLKKIH
jgi:hypothetical protein